MRAQKKGLMSVKLKSPDIIIQLTDKSQSVNQSVT